MVLNVASLEAVRLARELVELTGEELTTAVIKALEERLRRERARARSIPLHEELAAIRARCSRLPVRDDRRADQIIGYDDKGVAH